MSDELTERLPSDPSGEAPESPEQRAARAVGLDASQFAGLPSTERHMLVFMKQISDRLEQVEKQTRQTRPMSGRVEEILAEVLVMKSTLDQINTRLGFVERNVRDVNRELLSMDERTSKRFGDLSDRVAHLEDRPNP